MVQFEGLYDHDGQRMIEAVRAAAGTKAAVWRFPWFLLKLAAPFGGFAREAAEIAPYWSHPMRFDNRRLVELLGEEPRTPLDAAMRATLAEMGSLGKAGHAEVAAA